MNNFSRCVTLFIKKALMHLEMDLSKSEIKIMFFLLMALIRLACGLCALKEIVRQQAKWPCP